MADVTDLLGESLAQSDNGVQALWNMPPCGITAGDLPAPCGPDLAVFGPQYEPRCVRDADGRPYIANRECKPCGLRWRDWLTLTCWRCGLPGVRLLCR